MKCYNTSEKKLKKLPRNKYVRKYGNLKNLLRKIGPTYEWQRKALERVLSDITFEKKEAIEGKKWLAVISGRYVESLIENTPYKLIDVYILMTKSKESRRRVNDLHYELSWLYITPDPEYVNVKGILYVIQIGKVKFTVRIHRENCLCEYHINRYFMTYHYSRWKIEVLDGNLILRYMQWERENDDRDVDWSLRQLSKFEILYIPRKEMTPSSLFQQAMRKFLQN